MSVMWLVALVGVLCLLAGGYFFKNDPGTVEMRFLLKGAAFTFMGSALTTIGGSDLVYHSSLIAGV